MKILTGPCVLEDRDTVMRIAEKLNKANRTSLDSYRGPGLEEGLKLFQEIKEQFGYKLVTDIHESTQAAPAGEVLDILQIPAFLCRQTDLLVAAAKTNCIINIKKGQFLAAGSMKHPVDKVLRTRGIEEVNYENSDKNGVWLCERGNVFGYGSLIVDMKNLIAMREFAPVIFDATHSAQVPSTGGTTGGNSAIVPSLAKAAAAVGVDGFFFETHTNPDIALSDGPNMVQVDKLYKVIDDLFAIQDVLNYK